MRKFSALPAAAALAAALPFTLAAQTDQPVFPELLEFADSVRACEPASATMPHPMMPDFEVEHTVTGMNDGLCDYNQTMPGGMTMLCAFDDEARTAYAEELENWATTGQASGSMSGPQPAWASACEIETASGERMPVGSP